MMARTARSARGGFRHRVPRRKHAPNRSWQPPKKSSGIGSHRRKRNCDKPFPRASQLTRDRNPFCLGAVMKKSLESFDCALIVWLVSAIVFLSVLIFIGATLAAPPPAEAATDVAVHRSVAAMPPCTRRVTVTSKPCGAVIYVDGIQVGRTPMSFPMPEGRYTLVLLAPGHQRYAQRFLVPDAPLKIEANLVPSR